MDIIEAISERRRQKSSISASDSALRSKVEPSFLRLYPGCLSFKIIGDLEQHPPIRISGVFSEPSAFEGVLAKSSSVIRHAAAR